MNELYYKIMTALWVFIFAVNLASSVALGSVVNIIFAALAPSMIAYFVWSCHRAWKNRTAALDTPTAGE